jgi:hypothetical protein
VACWRASLMWSTTRLWLKLTFIFLLLDAPADRFGLHYRVSP